MKRKFRESDVRSGRRDPAESGSRGFLSNRVGLFVGVFAVVLLGGGLFLYILTRDLPSLQQLEDYQPKLSSKVYSADLKLIHEYYEEKRSFVPLEEIPQAFIDAVIATEDRRFYDHWGMNLNRFAQAVVINLMNLSYEQGASTLTQQLARQVYLETIGLEKTITRKIKELITAIQIERTYTKEEILEMYLNHMNFGHGSYGVQSAARKYFAKDASDLSEVECATLIGLLPAPSIYTPFRNPDLTLKRRTIVLSSMRDMGYLEPDAYQETLKVPLEVTKESPETAYGIAPYFTEYIRQLMQEKYGYNLYTDGLSIYTTLDSRAQIVAETAVQAHLKSIQKNLRDVYSKKNLFAEVMDAEYLDGKDLDQVLQDSAQVDSLISAKLPAQVALVSIDPRNGHILAFIGGRDFSRYKYNRAVQARRQPGSAFKPFIYTVAIDNGFPTTYEVLNQPVVTELPNGERWSPQNYDLSVGGPTTIREGLQRSLNLVTVRILQSVIRKPSLVVDYAQKMGIKSPMQAVDALALGSSDVTPLEITSAYGVFANGGVRVDPVAILRVEDKDGNIIEQNIPRREEVLRKETAFIMTDLLRTVIDRGTGVGARTRFKFYRPAGGKTGTTNDWGDAWFLGFTPQIVTGVWVGLDNHVSLGRGQAGSVAALPIWAPYMKAAHDTLGLPVLDFPMPDGVVRAEVCRDTKNIATDFCPAVLDEVYEKKLVPRTSCEKHVSLSPGRSKRDRKRKVRF